MNTAVTRLGSEALGTLFFVLLAAGAVAGAGAAAPGSGSGSGPGVAGAAAWALALVVAVWVFSGGGGHLNPFVTLGLALRGRFSWAAVPGRVVAQLAGGFTGALLAWWLFGRRLGDQAAGLAATHTAATGAGLVGAVAAEALVTFALVLVVYRLAGSGALYGLGYGLTYGAGVLAIGGLTGASMNLARTLGAELTMTLADHHLADWGRIWVYLFGPLAGVLLAWRLYPLLSVPDSKSLPTGDDVHAYVRAHSTAADPLVADLIEETRASLPDQARWQITPEQAGFLTMLARLVGARAAVEVGTFTGLSSLAIVRGMGPGGRLVCLDLSAKFTAIATRYWERAGIADQIVLRLGDAGESLRSLPAEPHLDLAFIDADRDGYLTYWAEIVPRMRPGGVIVVDNVLLAGQVVDPDTGDEDVAAIRGFNEKVVADERVDVVMLPIADGLTIARRR